MHPDTPSALRALLDQAERSLARPSGDPLLVQRCEAMLDTVLVLRARPVDDMRLIDDATAMLARCVICLEREGPFGPARPKWQALTQAFVPFVREDLIRALQVRPATSEQERPR